MGGNSNVFDGQYHQTNKNMVVVYRLGPERISPVIKDLFIHKSEGVENCKILTGLDNLSIGRILLMCSDCDQ
jgi:hypothetical protein